MIVIFISKWSGEEGDVAAEKDGGGPGGDGRLLYWGGGRGDFIDMEKFTFINQSKYFKSR